MKETIELFKKINLQKGRKHTVEYISTYFQVDIVEANVFYDLFVRDYQKGNHDK